MRGFLNESHEFFLIVAETAAEAAEGIGRTDNHRIAEGLSSHTGIVDRVDGLALDGLDLNLVELHEKFPVFGIHDGAYGSSEH